MAHPRPWVSRDGEGKHLATSARPHRRLSKRTANVGMARVPAEGLGARSIHATMLGVVGERLPLASTDNVAARNNRPLPLRTRIPAVQQGSEQHVHCRRPSFCVRAEDEAHWLEQHCQLWHLLQQPNARLGRHGPWQPGRHGRTPVGQVARACSRARQGRTCQSAVLACVLRSMGLRPHHIHHNSLTTR